MKHLLLFLAGLGVVACLQAQPLVPYLGKNGLKGLADTSGNVLIAPQFTELDFIVEADKPFFYAKKDGTRKCVLRNGQAFDANGSAIKYVVNFTDDKREPTATWTDVVALDFSDKSLLVNTRTGKQYTCARLEQNGYLDWFPVNNHSYLGTGVSWNAARFGLIRVEQPGQRFNLVDAELKPIFPKDYAAVTVVDATYCLVANEEKRVAVANREGKILTPFNWQLLLPTEQKGLFITEPPYLGISYADDGKDSAVSPADGASTPPAKRAKTGLVDATGQYIIAPIWVDLRVAGPQFLIFETQHSMGIMDYAGNILWETPIEDARAKIEYTFGRYFLFRSMLIDEKGAQVLDFEYDQIAFEKDKHPAYKHFYYSKGELRGLLNEQLDVIFEGKLASIVALRYDDELFFETHEDTSPTSPLKGLLDADGKVLFPVEYTKFDFHLPFIRLHRGEQKGVGRTDGTMVLPCTYNEIHFNDIQFSVHEKGFEIYAKPTGQHTYQGFDAAGSRLPARDCIHPMERDQLLYQPSVRRDQPQSVIFADGRIAYPPAEWGTGRQNLIGMGTPSDFIVIKENPSHYALFNSALQPLLPPGYAVPRKYYNPRVQKHLSLVAVYQENPRFQSSPPPVVHDAPAQNAPNTNAKPLAEEEELPVLRDMAVAENDSDYLGTGVLNGRGEWVLPPAQNVRYQPVSNHLVLEYALTGTQADTRHPRKLHRVNHPEPTSWPIAYVQDLAFAQPFDNAIVWQQHPLPDRVGKVSRCTWLGADGRQYSDFKYAVGPRQLTAQNLVALDENGVKKWQIVNQNLEVITDLPADWEVPDGGISLHFGYVPVKKGGQYGLMDSIGQLVMPFAYSSLTILKGLPLVQEAVEQPNGKKRSILRDFSGRVLGESTTQLQAYDGDDAGLIFIRLDEDQPTLRTLVFTPQGDKVLEVPGGKFLGTSRPIGSFLPAKFVTNDNHNFWVDLTTGRVFRE